MALFGCPECGKRISEHAAACSDCGFSLTPAIVAEHKEKQKASERLMGVIVIGSMLIGWAICSGVATPRPSSTRSTLNTLRTPGRSYAENENRLRELGNKGNMTQNEIREYLELDAQQSVHEGLMSRAEFEKYTGHKFAD